MEASFWFDTVNMGWSIVYIEGSQVIFFPNKIAFFTLKIVFVLANSVDPDEVPHLGFHCLLKYVFRSH